MHLGIFLDEWRDGGVPVFLERLERFLTARGHQVFLFLARPHPKRDPMSRDLYDLIKARLGERCVSLDLDSLPPAWRATHFQRALFSRHITCLLINHFYHHTDLLATLAPDLPLVSAAHNDTDCYYAEYLRSRHLTRAHVVVSERILEKTLLMTEPTATGFVRYIPYGVAEGDGRFQPEVSGPLRVIYSARLDPVQKRCDDLVPVWKSYRQRGGLGQLTVLGTGKHEKVLRQSFGEEMEKGSVLMRGQLTAKEALDEMAGGDVLLNLSNFEGLPQVVLEGATLGLYPLLSDIESGHRQIVREIGTGTLCHTGDVDHFVRELLRLEQDLPTLRKQRRQLRQSAVNHYSFEACGVKYLALFQELALPEPLTREADVPVRSLGCWMNRAHRLMQYRRHFGS